MAWACDVVVTTCSLLLFVVSFLVDSRAV